MSQVKPEWLGSFYGDELSFNECEILTIQNFTRKESGCEAELMSTKWFDYRQLHPLMATYYFIHEYHKAYGDFMCKAVDVNKRGMKAFKGLDFLDTRERKSFSQCRQLADRLGIRYDFFMRTAMNWFFKKGWLFPPRPQHIHNNEDLVSDIMLAWEDELDCALQIARNPYYQASEYKADGEQIAYQRFIVGQIRTRGHKRFSINAALYIHDVLRLEEAVLQFDINDVMAAQVV